MADSGVQALREKLGARGAYQLQQVCIMEPMPDSKVQYREEMERLERDGLVRKDVHGRWLVDWRRIHPEAGGGDNLKPWRRD